ncbi:AAA family ATPase, partial [candidate division KSB1 bacterium]|nr:AAA family ATPase [candidate division KSB1 bacterium]
MRRIRDFLGTDNFHNIMKNIKDAIGLKENDKIYVQKGGGVYIREAGIGREISIQDWADGYRFLFNLILDIFGWAMRSGVPNGTINKNGDIKGILLIDEIEQHLHPSLQIKIYNKFKNIFPKMQIIASTHSPFVVLNTTPEEIIILSSKGKYVEINQH